MPQENMLPDDDHQEFANTMRAADQAVAVNAKQMTKALSKIRKRTKLAKSAALIALVPACLVVAFLSFGIGKPVIDSQKEVAGNFRRVETEATTPNPQSNLDQPEFSFSDELQKLNLLKEIESLKSKSALLEQEIKSLEQTSSRNEWLLTRELVSRDGISDSHDSHF